MGSLLGAGDLSLPNYVCVFAYINVCCIRKKCWSKFRF